MKHATDIFINYVKKYVDMVIDIHIITRPHKSELTKLMDFNMIDVTRN